VLLRHADAPIEECKEMEEDYVAFLDILGFAATVQGHDATSRIAPYRKSEGAVFEEKTGDGE
jgi:hypothetical protein